MNIKRRRKFPAVPLALLLLLLAGTPAPASAADYYVATTGNDANPGTLAAPFRTIARGSRALASGDTLYIRAGTYAEVMYHGQNGFVFRNGTANAYTRYAAYPGEQVTIRPPPSNNTGLIMFFETTNAYIEVSGFILDAINARSTAVLIYGKPATSGAHHIRILRNEFFNGRQGIGGGHQSEIIGNKFHDMKGYGMYLGGDNGLIEGNVFHDLGGYAIHHFQSVEPVRNWVIRNNVMYRTGLGFYKRLPDGGLRWQTSQAIVISKGGGTQFYNNLVYDNKAGGVYVAASADDALIANNTIYGNGEFGILAPGRARVINNIAWNNKAGQILNPGNNATLQNNLTTDPSFVNAAGGDFHLNAGSPAIDAGQTLSEFNFDFAYGARPFGSAYDIGAYEFGSTPGAVTPPGGGAGTGGGTGGVPTGGVIIDAKDSLCNPVDAPVKLDITVTGPGGDHDSGHGNDEDHDDDDNPGGGSTP